jgi:hypothetical protein
MHMSQNQEREGDRLSLNVYVLCLLFQVSLTAVRDAIGNVEEVTFVLFGKSANKAYVSAAGRLFGPPQEKEL